MSRVPFVASTYAPGGTPWAPGALAGLPASQLACRQSKADAMCIVRLGARTLSQPNVQLSGCSAVSLFPLVQALSKTVDISVGLATHGTVDGLTGLLVHCMRLEAETCCGHVCSSVAALPASGFPLAWRRRKIPA